MDWSIKLLLSIHQIVALQHVPFKIPQGSRKSSTYLQLVLLPFVLSWILFFVLVKPLFVFVKFLDKIHLLYNIHYVNHTCAITNIFESFWNTTNTNDFSFNWDLVVSQVDSFSPVKEREREKDIAKYTVWYLKSWENKELQF